MLIFLSKILLAQDLDNMKLFEESEDDVLAKDMTVEDPLPKTDMDVSEFESVDEENELAELRKDIQDTGVKEEETSDNELNELLNEKGEEKKLIVNDEQTAKKLKKKAVIFDLGEEEAKLLEMAKFVEGKIPSDEWAEIAVTSKEGKYIVQEGDWLWKIAKQLFGSGFYYSKIWSLNPYITNPHQIEPGMELVFSTGDFDRPPSVTVGKFATDQNIKDIKKIDFADFGDSAKPRWVDERDKLVNQGTFFQYASEETYDDLFEVSKQYLNREYQKYEPPVTEIVILEPDETYDDAGFDKTSRVTFDFKEGFSLNSFVTTNVVQDLGKISFARTEALYLSNSNKVYVDFDESVGPKPGDLFSIYSPEGVVEHEISDRRGYRYTIKGQLKVIKLIDNIWECELFEVNGVIQRGDRVTIYTPKINKVFKTFNRKKIEAAIVGAYRAGLDVSSFGDVLYLDRGRADGVEIGNVFDVYSFEDRSNGRKITVDPTYKIGELTIVSLTDNFATALVTHSRHEIEIGSLSISKSKEEAIRSDRNRNGVILSDIKTLENKAQEDLDIELNIDNINNDLLEKIDSVKLTDDELDELERQEREKSVIRDQDKDLRALEKIENQIELAEQQLDAYQVDEDKLLEQQDLNNLEGGLSKSDPNAFESMNDLEKDIGKKYLDENLNSKENPYGLTEFDIEKIDELLNTNQQ